MKCSSVEGGREGGKEEGATLNPRWLLRQIDLQRGSAEGAGVGISGALRPEGVLQSPAQLSQFRKWMVLFLSWPRGSPLCCCLRLPGGRPAASHQPSLAWSSCSDWPA